MVTVKDVEVALRDRGITGLHVWLELPHAEGRVTVQVYVGTKTYTAAAASLEAGLFELIEQLPLTASK